MQQKRKNVSVTANKRTKRDRAKKYTRVNAKGKMLRWEAHKHAKFLYRTVRCTYICQARLVNPAAFTAARRALP